MRIVITGASGNAGTALLRRLAAAGTHELIGISRRVPPAVAPYAAAEWISIDIAADGAPAQLRDAFAGADAVVHLAWLIQPSRQRELLRRVNQDGTAAVADAAVAAGVRQLVHQSSVGTYAPGPGLAVDEDWPATGVASSSYSVDKAAAERAVIWTRDHLVLTRLRPALIFHDAAASEVKRYFLGGLVPHALLRPGLLRFAPLPNRLAFQVASGDDVAAATELVLNERAHGAFNVAAEPVIDRAAFADALGGVGPPLPAVVLRTLASATWHGRLQPTEPGWVDLAAQAPIMKTDRLRALGWSPQQDARTVLKNFVTAIARGAGHPGPLLYPIADRTP